MDLNCSNSNSSANFKSANEFNLFYSSKSTIYFVAHFRCGKRIIEKKSAKKNKEKPLRMNVFDCIRIPTEVNRTLSSLRTTDHFLFKRKWITFRFGKSVHFAKQSQYVCTCVPLQAWVCVCVCVHLAIGSVCMYVCMRARPFCCFFFFFFLHSIPSQAESITHRECESEPNQNRQKNEQNCVEWSQFEYKSNENKKKKQTQRPSTEWSWMVLHFILIFYHRLNDLWRVF